MIHRVLIVASVAALGIAVSPPAKPAFAVEAQSGPLERYAAYVGRPDAFVATYRTVAVRKPGAAAASPEPAAGADSAPDETGESTTYRRGALFHEIVRSAGVSTEGGFNGRAYWSANENRYTVLLLEDAARRAITFNAIAGGAIPEGTTSRETGTETLDGALADVVRVTPRGGVSADLAIDRASGALRRVVFDPDDRYRRATLRITGYTEIAPGVRIPAAYRYGEGPRHELLRGATRVVSDDELAAPKPASAWSFGKGEPVLFDVERGTYAGRQVILHASINGRPGRFLLDSGAGQILLYEPYAKSLGLTVLGKTAYQGISGGSRSARFARAETIAVGDNTLSNVVVAVSERDADAKLTYDGILGFDLLAGALVSVDLTKNAITFADPSQFQPTVEKGAFAFPVNLADNTPEVLVKVGNAMTRATFDTGDSHFATLSENLVTSGRLVASPIGSIYFTGVDGITPEPATCYDLNEISVGPYRYQHPQVCLAKEAVFGKDGGLIGFDFLRHFNWTFDYTRGRVVMTPNGT